MNIRKSAWMLSGIALCVLSSAAYAHRSEQGQEAQIKSLSAEQVQDMLAGKSMDFAKAAQLNGYPGPGMVLQRGSGIGLSAEQKTRVETIHQEMQSKASGLGRELVAEERKLNAMFADKSATQESLAQTTKRIGELNGQLRLTHLEAHLATVSLLSPGQIGALNSPANRIRRRQ